MPNYSLRPATAQDTDVVATIWRDGWPDGHLGNVPDELVKVRTDETFDTRTAERLGATTVAVSNEGEVAGFIMVIGDEVEQVYVAKEHRGSGVATLLLKEAESQVSQGGHRRAWLAVAVGNDRAIRFYERCGWTDDGTFEYEVEGGTITVPCHRYVKNV